MARYILKRLILIIPILIAVSIYLLRDLPERQLLCVMLLDVIHGGDDDRRAPFAGAYKLVRVKRCPVQGLGELLIYSILRPAALENAFRPESCPCAP